MNRQQLKASNQYMKAKEKYIEYAFEVRYHVSNEHKTVKALDVAGDALIIAFFGDDPMWREHGLRGNALRAAAERANIDIYCNF
jgi:hypothetical protein